MIRLEDVSVIRQGRPTLNEVTFSVEAGQQWAVIGPNGAGKSTLLSICATATMPTGGEATVFGQRLGTIDKSELRRKIGYVTNHHQLEWPLTALEIALTAFTNSLETPMRWSPTEAQTAEATSQLVRFGLGEKAQTKWMKLSQGELARLLLARALIIPPALLLHGRIIASGPAVEVLTTENISDTFKRPIAVDYANGRWSARSLRPSR